MIAVLGLGGCLPAGVLTNDDLSKMVDTSDEWIYPRTGMKQRRIAKEETLVELAVNASREALARASVDTGELGFIICATVTPDSRLPNMASHVHAALGASCPAFDLNAACSGFLYTLYAANKFYEGKPILVIGAEKLSSIVDYTDRRSCILFGDGAAAAVVGEREGSGLLSIEVNAYPDEKRVLSIAPNESGHEVIVIDGQEVYKFATREMASSVLRALTAAGLGPQDVDWLVPHQANVRIIRTAAERLGIPMEKVFVNIEHLGNTSAASVPLALWELDRSGKLQRGQIVAAPAFGGGLTSGAAVFRW